MKNDTDGVPLARTKTTDAVAQIDAIVAFRAFDGPIVNREGDGIALAQRYPSLSSTIERVPFGPRPLRIERFG